MKILNVYAVVALLGSASWASQLAAAPYIITDPTPDIVKAGRLGVADFVTAPPTADGLSWTGIQGIQPLGDRLGRLSIHDTRGQVWVTDKSAAAPKMFINIRTIGLGYDNSLNVGESGLHGLAFHPNFDGNRNRPGFGKFYAAFTVTPDKPADFLPNDNLTHTVLYEFSTDPSAAAYAQTAAPREIWRIGKFEPNHNVGRIGFNDAAKPGDADYGNLYLGYGDGGGGNDPRNYARDLDVPLGKILRVNPLDPDGAGPLKYSVPADNPFVGKAGLDEIWASGFRHPQHLSFDSETGQLYVSDFGQGRVEEVNQVVKGGDHGWQLREGAFQTSYSYNGVKATDEIWSLEGLNLTDGLVYPIAQYDHDDGNFGITSAFVYRGKKVPELFGKLIFTDIGPGSIFYLDLEDIVPGQQATFNEFQLVYNGIDLPMLGLQSLVGYGPRIRTDARLGFDDEGEIYITTKGYGRVFKLVTLQVPAPAALGLFALGVLGLAAARRRG